MESTKITQGYLKPVVGILSSVTILIGILALAGWFVGIRVLSSFGSAVPMAPVTAFLFMVYGSLVFLHQFDTKRLIPPWMQIVFGYGSTILALLLSVLSLLGIHLEIEHLGLPISGMVENVPLGHISPLSSLLFFLIGVSYLFLPGNKPVSHGIFTLPTVLASLVVLSSFVMFMAYIMGSPVLYGSNFIPPALSTSVTFFLLGIAVLIQSIKSGWMNSSFADISSSRLTFVLASSFLLLAIGIITAGYWYYRNFEIRYKTEVGRQLSAIADLKVNQILSWKNERYADADFLFKNNTLAELINDFFNNPGHVQTGEQISAWLSQIQMVHQYERITLIDPMGKVRICVPSVGTNSSPVDSAWLREVVSSGAIRFHDLTRDPSDSSIFMSMLVPIQEMDTRKILGIVEFRIDPEVYLYPMIKKWPLPSTTAENIIVRGEGSNVLFLNELRFKSKTALNLRSPLSDTTMPAVRAVLGKMGNTEGRDYRGIPVIAYVTKVDGTPWYLVSRIDKTEVFSEIRNRLWGILLLISTLLICAAMVVAYIWRHQHAIFYKEKFQAAKALQISIERFVKAFETNAVLMLILRGDGTIVEVNRFVEHFLGYKQAELIGRNPDEIALFADDVPKTKIRNILASTRHLENFEVKLLTRDRAVRYGNLSVELLEAGEELYWLAVVTDITEIKNAQESVVKLNRVYTILSDINQAIVRIRDPHKLFETACKIAVDKGQLPLTWIGIVHEPDGKLVPVAWAGNAEGYLDKLNISKNGVPCSSCPIDQAIHDGNYHSCNILENAAEVRPCRKEALESGFQSILCFPLLISGNIRGTINFYASEADFFTTAETRLLEELAMDISFSLEFYEKDQERLRAETALADSEKRLHLLIDGVKDYAIYSLSDSGMVTSWNLGAERLHGFAEEEVMGLAYSFFFPDLDQKENKPASLLERAATLGSVEEEGMRFHKNRSWFLTNSVISAIYNDDGTLYGFAVITQDITRRRQIEDELQRMNSILEEKVKERTAELDAINKELESFSYSISHDLKAPLRAISGFAAFLKEDYAQFLDAEGLRLLSIIISNAKRMDQLIQDILTLSKISRKEINHVWIDMKGMAEAVFHEMREEKQITNIEFTLGELPGIHCDPILVRQVWTNLISNAIKYSSKRKDPKIEISFSREQGKVIYCVKDNGVGFNMKYYNKLFNIFQRLHSETDFEGSGVGLAIVMRIIQRFGGSVCAEGFLNKGAVFYFSLPEG